MSYKAHQAANIAVELEAEKDELEDESFFAEEKGIAFTKHEVLQNIQSRFEKQTVDADEYAKDWIATFKLINRIMDIERIRGSDDKKDKLVAVGCESDVNYSLKFIETNSELLHLSLLCEDSELYPDLQDDLRKTPAIEKRSRQLNRVLMRKGFEPIFLEMDDKQQLISGNAMLRHMAKIADPNDKVEGFRKVAGYLEAGQYLVDQELLEAGLNELTQQAITLNKMTVPLLLGIEND